MAESIKGLLVIASQEAVVLQTYPDSVGVKTIGIGHTASAGGLIPVLGMRITIEQALSQFAQDVAKFDRDVMGAVKVPITQAQEDAEVDFDINTGAFRTGTEAVKINAHDFAGAMATLELYDHAKGRVLPGLTARRKMEAALFETGNYPPITHIAVYDHFPGPVRMVPVSEINLSAVLAPPVGQAPLAPLRPAPAVTPEPNLVPVALTPPKPQTPPQRVPSVPVKPPFSFMDRFMGWLASFFHHQPAPMGLLGVTNMSVLPSTNTLNITSIIAVVGGLSAVLPKLLTEYSMVGVIAAVAMGVGILIQAFIPPGVASELEMGAATLIPVAEAFDPALKDKLDQVAAGLHAAAAASIANTAATASNTVAVAAAAAPATA